MPSPDSSVPCTKRGRLLIVDDEARLLSALCTTLIDQGYETAGFSNAPQALEALQGQEFDVLITDMQMPQMDGMELLREAQAVDPNLVAIMMTGHGTIETAVEAIRLGAFDYVQKPLKLRDLLPVLTRALEVRRLRQENLHLRESVGIYKLSVAIGITLDQHRILDTVMDAALEQFAADEVSILLAASDGQSLHVAAARGPRRGQLLSQQMPIGAGIAGWVASHQEALILTGPVTDPRFTPVFPHDDICSAMVAPMMVGGRCIGVLNVNATKPRRPFTLGQAKALTILTATAAPALQSAILHAQLRESEQRLREITENLPLVLWMTNADASQILYVNPGFERVWGRSCQSLLNNPRSWMDPIQPDDRLEVVKRQEKLYQGEQSYMNYRLVLPDGSMRFISDCCFPIKDENGTMRRIVGYAEDVTEKKQLEAQLRQAQKMEAFGQLAGGVAHDFNNLLTVITGFSEMILSGAVPSDKQIGYIQEIRNAGERATSLTRQLLAFSRKQILQPMALDLNVLVDESKRMLGRLIGEDIDLATVLDPAIGRVKADPGQIEQVILNLIVNARDAMPTGGHITIETRNVELDQDDVRLQSGDQPGKFVMLSVTDTGCGMDETTQAKIFEPFFTTKEVGKGTGLGLATVHGIIKQSGGIIEVDSKRGRGTTFKIYLPSLKESVAARKSSPDTRIIPRGTETVLLAEDEEGARTAIRITLESCGYTALVARDGDEALQICRQQVGPIHLLITDVVMPKMSGRQLAECVMAMRPDIKVLYLSGYTDDAIVRHGVRESEMAFLHKPFSPMVLSRKIREVLDASRR